METTTPAQPPTPARPRLLLPRGFVAAVALVLVIETLLARNQAQWQGPVFTVYQFTRKAVETGAANVDLLVAGDSVIKLGLQPRVLQERLGLTSYNLAHTGGQPPDTFFVLRRALSRGIRPKAILLDCKPNLLATQPYVRATETVDLRSLYDCLEFGWVSKNFGYMSNQLLAKALPSFKFRDTIGGEIFARWKNRPRPGADIVACYWRNWTVNLGGELASRNPAPPSQRGDYDERASLIPQYIDPVNHAFIKRILRLATREHIPVYWLVTPINPRVQAKRVELGCDQRYVAYLRLLQSKWPILRVIDGRNANYDPALFTDVTHLDYQGGYVYSNAVAEALGRGLTQERWVEIAPYRPPSVVPPLEDMQQSRLALDARATALK